MWGKTQTQADTPEKASKGSVKMPALNEYYKFLKSDKEVRASPEKRSNELTRSKTTPPVAARSGNVETATKSRYDSFRCYCSIICSEHMHRVINPVTCVVG